MYFPYINTDREVSSGHLRLTPGDHGTRISTAEGNPDLLAPRARTLQGYLLLRAAAQGSQRLWQAARVMNEKSGDRKADYPSADLKDYGGLPEHWGWEKGGVVLFDLAVTLPGLRDRGIALYQAFLFLFQGSRDFTPLTQYAGENATRKFLKWADYQTMDADIRDDVFTEGSPEPITEEELRNLLRYWCELFQKLCP